MHISLRLRQCVLCSGITTHCVCYHHKSMGNKFPYITRQYISFAPFLWQLFGRSTICMYVRLHPFIYPAYIVYIVTPPSLEIIHLIPNIHHTEPESESIKLILPAISFDCFLSVLSLLWGSFVCSFGW